MSEADKWRFYAAVQGALQGHAKSLLMVRKLLDEGWPLTARDESALSELVKYIKPRRVKRDRGRPHAPPFSETPTIARLIREIRHLHNAARRLRNHDAPQKGDREVIRRFSGLPDDRKLPPDPAPTGVTGARREAVLVERDRLFCKNLTLGRALEILCKWHVF